MRKYRSIIIMLIIFVVNISVLGLIKSKGIELTVSLSDSMEPKIMTNSIILTTKDTEFSELKVGDIISYEVEEVVGKTVMHRIKQKSGNIGFLTSGDNNQIIDNWVVREENYRNKYLIGFNFTAPMVEGLYKVGLSSSNVTVMVAGLMLILIIGVNTVISIFIEKGVRKMIERHDFYLCKEHRRNEKKGKVKFSMVYNKVLISSLVIATLLGGSLPAYAQENIQSKNYSMSTVEQQYHKSIDNIIFEINSTIQQLRVVGSDNITKNMLAGLINQVREMEEIYNRDYTVEQEKVVDVLDTVLTELVQLKNTKEEQRVVKEIKARILSVERFTLQNLKASAVNLSDIGNHWAKSTIEDLVSIGAISGYPDGTFKPNNTITRAEFLAISIRATTEVRQVTDITGNGPWYLSIYNTALKEGVITASEFPIKDMDKAITRQEMSKIMIKISENILGEKATSIENIDKYIADYNKIQTSHRYYIEQTYMKGIVTGYPDGAFKPNNTGTRAEASTMLLRLIDKSKREDISKKEVVSKPVAGVRAPMTIYQNDPNRPMAIEGDTFVKSDGTKVVLKVGPSGILGEGQGVATELGRVDERGSAIKHGSLGIADEVLGQPYLVDSKTGEGHYQREWDSISTYYRTNVLPKVSNPKDGQIVDNWFYYEGGTWYWIGASQNSK